MLYPNAVYNQTFFWLEFPIILRFLLLLTNHNPDLIPILILIQI